MKEKICSFNPEDEWTVTKADTASGNGQVQRQWGRSAWHGNTFQLSGAPVRKED